MKFIKDIDLKGKRVFLRADLNVSIKDGQIIDDFRLRQILPTINYIQENGGKVILATHIGQPDAHSRTNYFDEGLSTKIIQKWLEGAGYNVKYKIDLIKAEPFSHQDFDTILLLENLRFYNGEKGTPEERQKFAHLLKDLADIYINDAFALIHRNDCSITDLPKLFRPEDKVFGFLIEKEIQELNKIKNNPTRPFMVILGGNKVETKINLLNNFLNQDKNNRPDSIIIGGAIAYTFLASQGFDMGKSIVEKDYIDFAKEFLEKAKDNNIKILLPVDHVANNNICDNKHCDKDAIAKDIGPETIKLFSQEISKAKTIFINGSMGIYQEQVSRAGTKAILQAVTNPSLRQGFGGQVTNVYKIAGGGDCVAAVNMFNLQDKFNFLSTGGGATLAYLASKEPTKELPGLNL